MAEGILMDMSIYDEDFNESDTVFSDGSDEDFDILEEVEELEKEETNSTAITSSTSSVVEAVQTIALSSSEEQQSENYTSSHTSTPWSRNLARPHIHSFNPRKPPGPTLPIPDSPLEVFQLFYTDELLEFISEESNKYAQQKMTADKLGKFESITKSDIKAFLGFNILMGINSLPSTDMYWQKQHRYAPIADYMSRNRYMEINRYLHFTDNRTTLKSPSTSHDKLGKIRPLLDYLSVKFAETYNPGKNLSIGESVVHCQGHTSVNTAKKGIKVWVLADENGYFSRLEVSSGKKENAENALGAQIVKELTKDFHGSWHYVFFDSFFTSRQLLCDLESKGIYACGLAHRDRSGFPTELRRLKMDSRGENRTMQADNLNATVWLDHRLAAIMYTGFDPTITRPIKTLRKSDGTQFSHEYPKACSAFNQHKGGVELGDQHRGYYHVRMTGRKFYMYIANFLLDVAITNAFILHSIASPAEMKMKNLKFRETLASQLIEDQTSRRRYGLVGTTGGKTRDRAASCDESRQLPLEHFPIRIQKNKRSRRGRCAVCEAKKLRRDTQWHCRACKKWLCHQGHEEDCFLTWHTNKI